MFHGTMSRTALRISAVVVLAGLWSGPTFAKTKLQGEALRHACITAFGDRDHFDWVPRMGLENALQICNSALAQFPDDPEVRLYHAIARDQFAEHGGTQADNVFATSVYRELAEAGLPVAEYALGTMFDEEAGVTTEDALAYMSRARAGEFG